MHLNNFKITSEYLSHSGRKGQRWGIKHGPPYPLKPEQLQIIKAGSKAQRYASEKDPKYKGRKYVSLSRHDDKIYEHAAKGSDLWSTPDEKMYRYQLEFAKDVKVADAKSVTDHLVEKYGKSKKKYFDKDGNVDYTNVKTRRLIEKCFRVKMKKITSHYSKLGYDALMDPEDIFSGFADTPMIVIDSKECMRILGADRIKTFSEENYENYKKLPIFY